MTEVIHQPENAGTLRGYLNDKCHCDECRPAMARYQRERREKRKGKPIPDTVKHGSIDCYTNWHCRCDECRAERARVSKEAREAKR